MRTCSRIYLVGSLPDTTWAADMSPLSSAWSLRWCGGGAALLDGHIELSLSSFIPVIDS